jgi:hypothetical protein
VLTREDLASEVQWLDAHLQSLSDPREMASLLDGESNRLVGFAVGKDRDFIERALRDLRERHAVPVLPPASTRRFPGRRISFNRRSPIG